MASNVVNVFKKLVSTSCCRNAPLLGVGLGYMGQVSFTSLSLMNLYDLTPAVLNRSLRLGGMLDPGYAPTNYPFFL